MHQRAGYPGRECVSSTLESEHSLLRRCVHMNNTTNRQNNLSPSEEWQATLGELELQLAKPAFDAWLKGADVVAYEDGVYTIGARTSFSCDMLEHRLKGTIKRTLGRIAGRQVDVRFIVYTKPVETPPVASLIGYDPQQDTPNGHSCNLNLRYTFDAFQSGACNRLAFEISRAVSEHPAASYNPLFIHSGVGQGKTHLLHAIGLSAMGRGLNVLYVTAEQFTNEMVNSIRTRTTEEFRNKYRSVDMLLVDDVQFIGGKDGTQEEFLHTFNALYDSNRQIVLSCDQPPRAIVGLDARLRSRFEGGLVVEIQPPDYDTRVAVVESISLSRHMPMPAEVVDLIAQEVNTSIRELEGALNRVFAYCETLAQTPTVTIVQECLKDLICHADRPSPELFLQSVADHFGIDVPSLMGSSRKKQVAVARQIVMYLLVTETELSLQQVGSLLGDRDHTTIMHGRDRIRELIETDATIRLAVMEIKEALL